MKTIYPCNVNQTMVKIFNRNFTCFFFFLFQALTPKGAQGSLGMTTLNVLVTPVQAFFMEALITFVLVLTVEAVCDERRSDIKGSAPLAIGLSVAACNLAAVSLLSQSLNYCHWSIQHRPQSTNHNTLSIVEDFLYDRKVKSDYRGHKLGCPLLPVTLQR